MIIEIKDKTTDKIIETEYYKYLLNLAPQNIHKIKTKTEFLKSEYNFKIGIDKISSEDSRILNSIEDTYFRLKIKENG